MIGAFVASRLAPSIGYVGAILPPRCGQRRPRNHAGAHRVPSVSRRRAQRPDRLDGHVDRPVQHRRTRSGARRHERSRRSLNQISFTFGSVGVSAQRLTGIVASALSSSACGGSSNDRRLGRQFRAVVRGSEIAAACGIDVNRVSRPRVVMGSMMAAAAGALPGR